MGTVDRQLHLMPCAHQTFGSAGAIQSQRQSTTITERPILHLIAQHLPGIYNLQFTSAFERRPIRLGTGGDDHHVQSLAFHQCPVDAGVAHDAHTGQFHLVLQVGAGAAELAASTSK